MAFEVKFLWDSLTFTLVEVPGLTSVKKKEAICLTSGTP